MRAAVGRPGGALEILRKPVPEPGPGEVRVRLTACGICGSDLHFYHAGVWRPDGTPGHEMAGEIDALGDGVEGLSTGTSVAIEPIHSCGSCDCCQQGRQALCRQAQIYGVHRDGGFAEYLAVPARSVFELPPALRPQIAALTEPMAVVVHGLRRGALAKGQRVLVLGGGTIGLLSVVAARALGAGEVWMTARHPHQAELGAALGAARVLREAEADLMALDGAGRESPIDLVVETVGGSADTLDAAGAAARPGGAVSVLGVFMGNVSLNALPYFLKEITLAFSNCYEHPHRGADFETAALLVSSHRDALEALTTHDVPLDDIAQGFVLASDKKAGAVKVTVLP